MFEVAMLIGFSMTVYLVEVHAYFKRSKPRAKPPFQVVRSNAAKPPIVVVPPNVVPRRLVVITSHQRCSKGKRHD